MIANWIYRNVTDTTGSEDQKGAARFAVHLGALTATKIADGLIDAKLVLAWLLNSIGAPGYLIGALVPVRESGALLPQLALARYIEQSSIRKVYWVVGSVVQGLSALGMAASALFLQGAVAGWGILICLAMLALARAACSASYKDVLARTVEKGLRGRVSGIAGTVAASAVFGFAILLSTDIIPRQPSWIAAAIAVAGLLWLAGAGLFATLDEPRDQTAGQADQSLSSIIAPLSEDAELRTYIATRALLISVALAPPFLVMLGGRGNGVEFADLGILILAASMAAIVSSYVWGALSDRSSRQTLMLSGALSAVSLGSAAAVGFATGGLGQGWLTALCVFVTQIAYQGARAGRKTHLTDMDTDGRKSVYTALSNTVIGLLLAVGGGLGMVADLFGPHIVLALLACFSGGAVLVAFRLAEVQSDVD